MKFHTLILSSIFIMSGIAQEIKLPGNELLLDDVAYSAEGVYIAEFEKLGTPDVGSPGSTYYSNAILKITRNLAGGKSKTLKCAYSVQTYPERAKEEAPTLGKSFLILGSFSGEAFKVKKLVEPTAANVGLVEQALRARGVAINSQINTIPNGRDQDEAKHQTAQPVKASSRRSAEATLTASTPNEEPSTSTPRSIIIVLIVAALGMLWVLLKKRK